MMSPTLALLRAAYDQAEREHFDTVDRLIQPDAGGQSHPSDRTLRLLDATAQNLANAKAALRRGTAAHRRYQRNAS